MSEPTHAVEKAATRGGLPVSPSLGPTLESEHMGTHAPLVDQRVLIVSLLSVVLASAAAFIAWVLVTLINLITNLSFYNRLSTAHVDPTTAHWGIFTIVVPVVGAVIVGFMARYGSAGIRGHGIPEAMEQVLTRQSRIPARLRHPRPNSPEGSGENRPAVRSLRSSARPNALQGRPSVSHVPSPWPNPILPR